MKQFYVTYQTKTSTGLQFLYCDDLQLFFHFLFFFHLVSDLLIFRQCKQITPGALGTSNEHLSFFLFSDNLSH